MGKHLITAWKMSRLGERTCVLNLQTRWTNLKEMELQIEEALMDRLTNLRVGNIFAKKLWHCSEPSANQFALTRQISVEYILISSFLGIKRKVGLK